MSSGSYLRHFVPLHPDVSIFVLPALDDDPTAGRDPAAASKYLNGRLLSVLPPGSDGDVVELGLRGRGLGLDLVLGLLLVVGLGKDLDGRKSVGLEYVPV